MKRGRLSIIFVLSLMILTSAIFSAINTSFNNHATWAQSLPVAVVGANQTNVNEFANVTLNASESYSPDGATISNYNWTQIDSNPPVSLVSNGSTTTFQAPNVPGPDPVNYTFSLVVTDLNNLPSAPAFVSITVNNINQTGPITVETPTVGPPSIPPPVAQAPLATVTFPANGSTNIPTETEKITATFDQEINASSAKITLIDGVGNEIPVDFVAEGSTITITPQSSLSPGTNYTVTIDQITGLEKTNVGSTSFNFTTVAPPAAVPTAPPSPPIAPQPGNNPPQALDQQVTTEADKPIAITLGAADSDPGESLSAAIVTPPQPDHGSLGDIDQNTGNVTYTPAAGFTGTDSFTFKVTDSKQAESNTATVTINVTAPSPPTAPSTELQPVNNPPQALDQQVTTEADKPIAITLGAADSDPGESLSAAIVTPPQPDHGSLGDIDQNTGNVTYTPAAGFTGTDSFTFKVTDSKQAESNTATVTINVTAPSPPTAPSTELQPVNNPPQALDQQVTTEADKPIAITLGAADSDPGESLSAAIVTPPQPDHGSLGDIDQNTGNVTYTPAAGFTGTDSFTFKVTDSKQAESNTATVTINVTSPSPPSPPTPITPPIAPQPGNNPPQALDQQVTTEADKPIAITLGAADSDPGESLSAAIVTPPQPDHGSLGDIDQNTGNVTYTPAAGFTGTDSFTFKVTDSKQAESNTATVTINVTSPSAPTAPPNRPPEVTLTSNATSAKVGEGIEMKATVEDESPESIKLVWQQTSGQPTVNLTLSPDNKTASFTAPEVQQNTELKFTLTATDDKTESTSKDVTVTVAPLPVNLPPKVSAGSSQNVSSGELVKLMGTVTDEGTTNLLWTQTGGPTADISLASPDNADTTFISPPVVRPTKLAFNLTATDERNQKGSSKVEVTVNPVSLENDRDTDGDGIFNNVDKDINKRSFEFQDKLDQTPPQTQGKLIIPSTITTPKVTIKDAANEANGVVIALAPDAPSVINVTACGSSSTLLSKGDIILLTCGSADIKVIQGDAFTRLNTSDGSIIQGTLTEGNLIFFDPTKRTLTADSDNAGTVDLTVIGNNKMNEVLIPVGKTVTIPATGNVPGTTPPPAKPPATTTPPPAKPPATTTPPPAKPPATTTPPPAKPPATTTPPPAKPPATTPPRPNATGPPPVVSIQPVVPVKPSSNFILDGSQSRGTGPTDRLTFKWEQVSGPPAKPVSGQNTPRATYQAPSVNQSSVPLVFKLTAKNLRGVESSSQIPVTIATAGARPPVANGGPDLTVKENATVILNGGRSQDPDRERLTFLWIQTAGPTRVVLNNNTSPVATFKAPFVPTNNSLLVFRLTVKDPSGQNSSDLVRVNVQKMTRGIVDNPPVANAGRDQAVFGKANVTLDGSKSADPDVRDKLTYQWRQIGGLPRVGLLNYNQANASFVSPEVSTNTSLTFALTVSDPAHKNSTDTVKVIIMKPEGFPLWIIAIIAVAAAGGGFAAWYFLFRKPPKRRLTFVP